MNPVRLTTCPTRVGLVFRAVLAAAARSLATLALSGAIASATAQNVHPGQPSTNDDRHSIELSMKRQFDRPEAPLVVEPISIEAGFAVAGWIQHGRGGRALLSRESGQWMIVACAGDGLRHAKTLEAAGMSPQAARRLADKVAASERLLPPGTVAKFALFEGYVRVDHAGHSHGAAASGHSAHRSSPHPAHGTAHQPSAGAGQ